jgi:hypothetical protein
MGVFLIVFGLTRIAELLDWSHMHAGAVSSLGMSGDSVTILVIIGKVLDVVLTAVAALALVRRHGIWLLVALGGWTAGFATLGVLSGVMGDIRGLIQQACFFAVFAGLLAAAYKLGLGRAPGFAAAAGVPPAPTPQVTPPPAAGPEASHAPTTMEPTRQDMPVQNSSRTRQDIQVRRADLTRQDMPALGRRVAPPVKPDDVTRRDHPR